MNIDPVNIDPVNIALYEIYLTTKFSQCGNNTVCITYQHITFNMVSSADHCSPNVNCKVKLIPVTVRMLIFRCFEYHISSHLWLIVHAVFKSSECNSHFWLYSHNFKLTYSIPWLKWLSRDTEMYLKQLWNCFICRRGGCISILMFSWIV